MKNEQNIGSIKDLRPQKISNKLTFKLQRTANEYAAKRRRRAEEPQKGRNSCLRLTPRPVFGSFSIVLMSSKVNFHVVRSALQNSLCLLSVYFCWSGLLQILRFAAYSFAVHFCMVLPMFPRLVLSVVHFLCETSTWHLDSYPLGDTWYGVVLWVFKFNAGALKRSVQEFTAEPLCSLRRTDEPQKGRNSCLLLRPSSVFGSFGVVLMSCKVNFHVAWSNCALCILFILSGSPNECYMRRMRNNNLGIRIAGSSCRPQLHCSKAN